MHLIFSTVETCFDGIRNQDETSIDQGGVCDTTPPAGKLYTSTNSCIYAFLYVSKNKFVREAIRGIDFEKSLLERLSPEGGQNWHKLPSHTSFNMHKSNKNTSLAHHSGRKQGFLSTSPPTMNGLSWPAFKATFWDRLALACQLRGEYDKITCFHPLEHFLYHIQSFKAQ